MDVAGIEGLEADGAGALRIFKFEGASLLHYCPEAPQYQAASNGAAEGLDGRYLRGFGGVTMALFEGHNTERAIRETT